MTNEEGYLVWSADYLAWGKVKHLKGASGGASTEIASPDASSVQLWHTRTQPGRSNHLPEWVADNTGGVQRWRQLKEAERPQDAPEAVNDPSVWGEPTDQSIRFQGQWHDPETGLHYNRFRYYDPDVGRFIHQDPLGYDGGFNLYQYAPNPTASIDPYGLCSTKLNKALGGRPHDEKQAHHIIPEEVWKKNTAFFGKIGMGDMMDDRSNGILMPSSEAKARKMRRQLFHCGSHGGYSATVDQQVSSIRRQFEQGQLSADEARRQIGRLQSVNRTMLRAPLLPGTSPVRLS